MDIVRLTRQRRSASRDAIIDKLTLDEAIIRLRLLAPNDVADLEVIAKDLLRRRWPGAEERPVLRAAHK